MTTTRVTKFAKDRCHGHTSRLAAKPAVANGYIASDTEFSKCQNVPKTVKPPRHRTVSTGPRLHCRVAADESTYTLGDCSMQTAFPRR
jgi:hypothetical protein